MVRLVLALWVVLVTPGVAHAYIGPGMGAGMVATVLGFVGAIGVALFAVVYYPIKRSLKRRRASANEADMALDEESSAER